MIDDLIYDFRRSDWLQTGVPWLTSSQPFSDKYLKYINIHWPGREGFYPKDSIKSLNSSQISYLNSRGYNYGYGATVDLLGLTYQVRGLEYRAASNGDDSNKDDNIYGKLLDNLEVFSIQLMYGRADTITLHMINGVRKLVKQLLKKWPHLIVNGHNDMDWTECPGPQAVQLIKDGIFYPTPPQNHEGHMIYLPEPKRLYDSRNSGPLVANKLTSITLQGVDKKAKFVLANVTAFGVDQNEMGWLSVYGSNRTSSHNWNRNNEPIVNEVSIPVVNGAMRVYSIRQAHLIVDQIGYVL